MKTDFPAENHPEKHCFSHILQGLHLQKENGIEGRRRDVFKLTTLCLASKKRGNEAQAQQEEWRDTG